MKKRLLIALMAIVGSLLSTAWGQEPVTLKWAGWAFAEQTSANLIGELIDEFEAENPNITVETVPIQFFDFRQRITTLVGAGDPPDVAQSYLIWTPSWADIGALEPLDDYLSDQQLGEMLNAANGQMGGQQYAVTWSPGINIMFWNKNVFEQAGLDPENPPETWADLLSDCEAISQLSGVKCIAQTTQKEPSAWNWWFPQLWAVGGQLWDDQHSCVLDNAAGVTWAETAREWAGNDYITTGIDGFTMRQVFAQNQAGFLFDGPWMKAILRDLSGEGEAFDSQYGVGVRPVGPDAEAPWTTSADHQLVMFTQSKHKEEAWKLIDFLLRPEIQVKYYNILGLIPSMRPAYDDPALAGDPYIAAFLDAAQYVKPIDFGGNWPTVSDFWMNAIQASLAGDDPQSVLSAACRNIEVVSPPAQ